MSRHRTSCFLLALGGWGLVAPASAQTYGNPAASGQSAPAATTTTTATRADLALLQALHANPLTAPYRFATEARGNKVSLIGRVGSKRVHDVAIRIAIDQGVPVSDELVIDTAAGRRVADMAVAAGYAGQPVGGFGGVGFGYGPPALGPGLGYASRSVGFGYGYGPSPYGNYPSLFGQVGDPFYGFDPPAISYPPWWGELTAQRMATNPMAPDPAQQGNPAQAGGAANPYPDPNGVAAPPVDPNANAATNPGETPIDVAIDGRGVATIRGVVPTLADRIAVGQRLAQTQGVAEVINLLEVRIAPAAARSDTPPPFPVPAGSPIVSRPAEPQASNAIPNPNPAGGDPISRRAEKAIADRPSLASTGAKVKVRDGVASLTGSVPSAFEAMLAYRAVQQTPGVREVDDRLAFPVPDENNRNPLAEKGRPEDVEPYLAAQIRRQVGDVAHVDSVRARGDSLELKGTLGREEDRARFDAILRSMPLLRGFKVESSFGVDSP